MSRTANSYLRELAHRLSWVTAKIDLARAHPGCGLCREARATAWAIRTISASMDSMSDRTDNTITSALLLWEEKAAAVRESSGAHKQQEDKAP